MIAKKRLNFDLHLLAFPVLLAWLVLLALAQANPHLVAIGRDNGFFLYAGARILEGKQLYVDVWDHKGPAIFFINALGLVLLKNSRWGVWLVEYLFIFGAFFLGYAAIKKRWGVAAALFGSLAGMLALQYVLGRGNLTEEYPLLFNFFAIAIFFTENEKNNFWRSGLIGVMFALSFLFRANNGGIPVSIGLTILVTGLLHRDFPGTAKRLLGLALGAAGVLLLTALYFQIRGTLDALIGAAFLYNFLDTEGQLNIVSGFLAGLKNIGIVGYVLLAGYLAALHRMVQSLRRKQTLGKDFEILILLLIAWPVEIFLSSLSGLKFVHYFISWVPAVFLLSGFAYRELSEPLFSGKVLAFMQTSRANILFLIVTLLFSYATVLDYAATFQTILFNRQNGIDYNDRLSDFIRGTTAPDETVLVWGGEAGINFQARRSSPTRYNLFSRLLTDHPMNQGISETYYADVLKNPPELIIDMWKHSPDYIPSINPAIRAQQETRRVLSDFPAYARLLEYINAHYQYETKIDGYEIYRRKP